LIQSIVQGEWAIFENANLCNPSILDRLNPLLEEGNNSLCINEQGLIEGDKLRDIKAHANFRAIFVISEHSLVDQGKDVSRALKNRCLQIHVRYEPQCNASESLLGTEVKILERGEQLMQMSWDLAVIH